MRRVQVLNHWTEHLGQILHVAIEAVPGQIDPTLSERQFWKV
jgi:hypothetical protein